MKNVRELDPQYKLELVTKAFLGYLLTNTKMTRDEALDLMADMVTEFEMYDQAFKCATVQ